MEPVYLFFGVRDGSGSDSLALRCMGFYAARFGITGSLGKIVRTPTGKPVLEGGKLSFSVSHSGDLWICAVHTCPVGVDVEKVTERSFSAIARRIFLPQEQQYVGTDASRFYEIWCAKEAWVKLEGTGIARGFSGFCAVQDGKALTRAGDTVRFCPDLGPEYSVCLWAAEAEGVKILPIPGEGP